VIKLKENGKGSSRILGIDAFKVYNLYRELKEHNMGKKWVRSCSYLFVRTYKYL